MDNKLIDDLVEDDQEPEGSFCVVDIATDNLKSDYIAVSFAYIHPSSPSFSSASNSASAPVSKSFKLPFVCLYLCSTRPHLSATFLSIIDNNQTAAAASAGQSSSNDGIDKLVYPEEIRFNHPHQHPHGHLYDQLGGSSAQDDHHHFPSAPSSASFIVPVQLAIRWSNTVVSVSPCQTNKASY